MVRDPHTRTAPGRTLMLRHGLFLLLLATAPAAQAASLFFSPTEMEIGERIMDRRPPPPENAALPVSAPSAPEEAPPRPPDIYMGALIYLGPNQWSVWINGDRWTSAQPRSGDLRIAQVGPDLAEIIWTGDRRQGPLRVRLRPYQTFIGDTGEIVEGSILR